MWSDIDPAEERIDPRNKSVPLTSAASMPRGSILLPWINSSCLQQSDRKRSNSLTESFQRLGSWRDWSLRRNMYFFAVLVLLGTELRTVSSGKSHFSYTPVRESQRGEAETSLQVRFLVFIRLPLKKVRWFACVVWAGKCKSIQVVKVKMSLVTVRYSYY